MSEQTFQKIALRVALDQAISSKSDEYAERSKQYASRLSETRLDNTQVRGLENIANTTDKVSDITDWLKLRVGRDRDRERWAKDGIGREIVNVLEGLREDSRKIVSTLSYAKPSQDHERLVHLRLCREFVRHLAAHFEFIKVEKERR